MSTAIMNLDTTTFPEQIGTADLPVVVDFWAEWCGPCKMIAPVLEEIAVEQAGRLRVAKLNVDENPSVAQQFGVMSIPTLIVFRDGTPQHRIIGAKGKAQLLEELAPFLG
jgi:thioredoxin 1